MPKEFFKIPLSGHSGIDITGFLVKPSNIEFKPNILSLSSNNNCMNRKIVGKIDEYGFAYINVNIVSPLDDSKIACNVKAIIDTGAAYCLLKKDLLDYLNIEPFKKDADILHPVDGVLSAQNYFVNMVMDIENNDGAALLQQLRVGVIHSEDYPSAMIIGVELLKYCTFSYSPKSGIFELLLEI